MGSNIIKREAFRSILEVIESDKLVDVAKDVGGYVLKEFICFCLMKINLDTYLRYLTLVCQYAKFAECEIENDGKDYTIILSHDIGHNEWEFLAEWLTEGLRVTIGILPEIDVTRNSIVVRFHVS